MARSKMMTSRRKTEKAALVAEFLIEIITFKPKCLSKYLIYVKLMFV